MQTPSPFGSGFDGRVPAASMLTAMQRKRIRRLCRLAFTALVLTCTLLVLKKTVAMPHSADLTPMPFAYAYVPSPNCDDRPAGTDISCIVLHSTVEPTTEGTMGIFLDPAKKVSAHFVVGKDGRVVQMVPIERRAWHAGTSVLEGVGRVNDYSVGIEMVNLNDGRDPYPQAQMDAVAGLIRFVRARYTIPDDRIVSHEQIALPAGRKSDPAGFDFVKIKALSRIGMPEPVTKTTNAADHTGDGALNTDTKPATNP